jgi:hypothetical protein
MINEDIKEERAQEEYQEEKAEMNMYRDFDHALKQTGIDEDSTIKELYLAVTMLNNYGWEVTACELLDYI